MASNKLKKMLVFALRRARLTRGHNGAFRQRERLSKEEGRHDRTTNEGDEQRAPECPCPMLSGVGPSESNYDARQKMLQKEIHPLFNLMIDVYYNGI